MAEVAVARAAREDQVVESDFVALADMSLFLEVDAATWPRWISTFGAPLNWTRMGTAMSDGLRPAVAT